MDLNSHTYYIEIFLKVKKSQKNEHFLSLCINYQHLSVDINLNHFIIHCMPLFLLCLITQFSIPYQQFVHSPLSESIFVGLTRGTYEIADFRHDPVVLWFWRSTSGSAAADSLLKTNNLKRNFHLAAVLRWEAKETEDYETQLNKLHLATYLDSSAIENFLSLFALGVRHRDKETIKTALSIPVFSDFRNQVFIITNTGILLLAVVFLSGIVYLLVKTIYYLPVLSHRIAPRTHIQFFDILKSLILLIPILILRDLYLIFICYSVVLLLFMSKREKNWLKFNIVLLILLFILSLAANNLIAFLKKYDNNYQLYEITHYDSFSHPVADDEKEKAVLAYGLKTQGRLRDALSLYEDLYFRGYRSIDVVNNLANMYSLYDEPVQAESLYNYAILLTDRGEPFFNLGLLKLKNIEYAESSRFMREARKRNFASLSKEPVDIRPSNDDFYKVIILNSITLKGPLKYVYVIPIVVIFVLTFLPLSLSPPYYCTSCGKPICEKCLKELGEEIICNTCFTKFKSTKQAEVEERLRKSVDKKRKKFTRTIIYTLNLIVPGAGLIYLKKHLVGITLVCITVLGYTPLLFSNIFVKPTGWIALPLKHIFFPIALIFAVISYIISFTLIWGHHAD